MARVDAFDAFYHAARRPLLHQTYAMTGDPERAASAVEHAFAQAWSEWRKVRRLADPVSWVRNEAWRAAGSHLPRRRRLSARRRFVGDPSKSPHRQDLEALGRLPDPQRRAVVLHHLADLPTERIAREVGISEASAASLLIQGEQQWADGGTSIATALARLEDDIAGVRLTRGPSLRRTGERRHRQQALVGVVTASALLAGGGLLIVNDSPSPMAPASEAFGESSPPATPASERPDPPDASSPFLLDEDALLTARDLRRLTKPRHDWRVGSTTDGTTGDPIYSVCQPEPFADPGGTQSLLRRFEVDGDDASGSGRVSAVQVIEESRNERAAERAFSTMESWYARCDDDGVQLMDTLRVDDLGDEARAFRLREVGRRDTAVTVGLVRTGPVTTAVIASTKGDEPVSVRRVLDRAGVSVTHVCLRVSGDCSTRPEVRPAPPLPTEEHPGFLAAYDLPPISNVAAPWVGTDPARSPGDPAATPCERAHFGKPQKARTRVFVLPTAKKLPRRFGLAETVGTFHKAANARKFVDRAVESAASCTDRELSASDPQMVGLPGDHDGRVWRFEFEVDENQSVFYRVGLVRSGRRVALVSMSPSRAYDVKRSEFVQLVIRAGHRLSEAERSGSARQ